MRKRRNAAERKSLHEAISNADTVRDRGATPSAPSSGSFTVGVTFVRRVPVGVAAQFAAARFGDGGRA
jgi:hypothetical protein